MSDIPKDASLHISCRIPVTHRLYDIRRLAPSGVSYNQSFFVAQQMCSVAIPQQIVEKVLIRYDGNDSLEV